MSESLDTLRPTPILKSRERTALVWASLLGLIGCIAAIWAIATWSADLLSSAKGIETRVSSAYTLSAKNVGQYGLVLSEALVLLVFSIAAAMLATRHAHLTRLSAETGSVNIMAGTAAVARLVIGLIMLSLCWEGGPAAFLVFGGAQLVAFAIAAPFSRRPMDEDL